MICLKSAVIKLTAIRCLLKLMIEKCSFMDVMKGHWTRNQPQSLDWVKEREKSGKERERERERGRQNNRIKIHFWKSLWLSRCFCRFAACVWIWAIVISNDEYIDPVYWQAASDYKRLCMHHCYTTYKIFIRQVNNYDFGRLLCSIDGNYPVFAKLPNVLIDINYKGHCCRRTHCTCSKSKQNLNQQDEMNAVKCAKRSAIDSKHGRDESRWLRGNALTWCIALQSRNHETTTKQP